MPFPRPLKSTTAEDDVYTELDGKDEKLVSERKYDKPLFWLSALKELIIVEARKNVIKSLGTIHSAAIIIPPCISSLLK